MPTTVTTTAPIPAGTFAEYEQFDALGLAELVRRRDVSPRELVQTAIERIETRNPRLNAVIHRLYEDAMAAAAAVEGHFVDIREWKYKN